MPIFSPERTFIGYKLPPADNSITAKEQCLLSMIDLLSEKGYITDKKGVFDKLLERESYMSTGIGNHIAIPHIRHQAIKSFRAIIYLLDNELDFNSLDGRKVRLVIFTAIPENEGNRYMKLLGKMAEFLRKPDNRMEVLATSDRNKLYEIFRRIEDEI